MKGTEKQINWATDIRANVVKTFEAAINAEPNMETVIRPYIDRLNGDGIYAGDIIDLFKDILFNGDIMHDLSDIMAVYHVALANTDGQREILGR